MVQPREYSRLPAVHDYDVLLQTKNRKHQLEYGVPAPIREEERNNHMP
jgi:hypothetical protein